MVLPAIWYPTGAWPYKDVEKGITLTNEEFQVMLGMHLKISRAMKVMKTNQDSCCAYCHGMTPG